MWTTRALGAGVGSVVLAHRPRLLVAAACSALPPLVALAAPWPLAFAVDHVVDDRPLPGPLAPLAALGPAALLAGCAVAALLLAATGAAADHLSVLCTERACERIGADLRRAVFARAVRLSLRFHHATRSGELVSRLTSDVGRVLDAVNAATFVVVSDGLLVLGAVAVLAGLDPTLALTALAVVPPLALVAHRQRSRVRAAQQAAREEAGTTSALATDLLRNVAAVQVFSRRGAAERRFDERNDALLRASLRAAAVQARWTPRAELVLALGSTVALVVGVLRVRDGVITTGVLVLVMAYVRDLYGPVRSLAKLSGTFAKAGASVARLCEVVDNPDYLRDLPQAPPARPVRSGIAFHGVRFGYGAAPVLDGLDLWLPAGATTVVTGPSGVGKSTLLHLLLRLYDPDAGAVLVDGVDLRDLPPTGVRGRAAFVPQDPWLLDGSIAENIALGGVDVARQDIRDAARLAHVEPFVRTLPRGLNSPVGEGGRLLSGGQQRRVAIARAVVSGASLLLVDEPTVGLDPAARAAVLDALASTARGRTTVIVTHDPEVLRLADHVVELRPPAPRRRAHEEVTHDDQDHPAPGLAGARPAHAHPYAFA